MLLFGGSDNLPVDPMGPFIKKNVCFSERSKTKECVPWTTHRMIVNLKGNFPSQTVTALHSISKISSFMVSRSVKYTVSLNTRHQHQHGHQLGTEMY